jgi:hypothetical protein
VESEYDARADLEGAVGNAITSVNKYAAFVSTLGGGPAVTALSQPLSAAVKFGAGLYADQRQKKRLLAANAKIKEATQRLRDALTKEADVFQSLSTAVVDERVDAQIALLDAGLVTGSGMIIPMIADLGLEPSKNADATIAKSRKTRIAVESAYRAAKDAEASAMRTRYRVAIASLDALLAMHDDFAHDHPVDLNDVLRFVAELDAAVSDAKKN